MENEDAVLPDESGLVTGKNADGTNLASGKKETETPSEATADNKQKEQTQSSEGENTQKEKEVPFHEHPRWKAREEEWNRKLSETQAQYENRIAELDQKFSPILKANEKVSVPAFFAKVYGDDPELYKEYLADEEIRIQRIKEETISDYENRIRANQQAQEAESKRWTDWVESSISGLKNKGEVFDENELKAIAIKYKPTDDLGNIDFALALELLKEKKSEEITKQGEKSNARKELASQTTSSSKGENKSRDYLTHKDFR